MSESTLISTAISCAFILGGFFGYVVAVSTPKQTRCALCDKEAAEAALEKEESWKRKYEACLQAYNKTWPELEQVREERNQALALERRRREELVEVRELLRRSWEGISDFMDDKMSACELEKLADEVAAVLSPSPAPAKAKSDV